MWFNLASANGHSEAAQERDVLAEKMTPVLVDKAQDLAVACMDSDYQDCALGKKTKLINKDQSNNLIPMTYSENDKARIKKSFRDQSLLRRKQIQYALRKLGYYTSSVDGLWGKGTEQAVVNYGQDKKLWPNNTSELFASALSKVDVPSSFAVAQPKKKPVVKISPPPPNSYGLTALIFSTSLPADQAMAVCRPQANAAKSQAKRSHRPRNTTFSGSCRQDYFGNYNCTGGNSLSGGKWGGVLSAFESVNAGKKAYEAVLQSCLAGYCWRDCQKNLIMKISITTKDQDTCSVTVTGSSTTNHTVTISDQIHSKLTDGKISKETLLERSFEFLLQREPNTSILGKFKLEVISQYFPDYAKQISKWQ